jgi:8-oxo-dGTP pyrophosphatase MutT (NUDIX family)
MLTFHATGDWMRDQVTATSGESTRLMVPEVEQLIEETWANVLARPGVHLFDGPMCRLESWHATPQRLKLTLSRTSYKPFLGTNLHHPELADRYGRAILANPVGVSPALRTADGWLMMGRRNASVAYYPNRIHPFAGAMEPKDGNDIFAAVRRELAEELGFTAADIAELLCTGIAEDRRLRQPELIFRATSTRTRAQIESGLDPGEHHASWAIRATGEAIDEALKDAAALTPVAIAALLLWGRAELGEEWFRPRQKSPESYA